MSARAPQVRALPTLHLQLLVDGADCSHCPLGRGGVPGRPVASEYFGRGTPSVALIGEAPGRREIQTGRPFIGPSGKLLDYACAKAGVPRGELVIMNAAACGPIPSANDTMKREAIAACRPRLLSELRRISPKVIMAIGSHSLRSLSPEGAAGVTALRGALLPLASDVFRGQSYSEAIPLEERDLDPSNLPHGHAAGARAHAEAVALAPAFMSTFHPAHILRGGDGDQDQPGGESTSAVDLLFYFFLYDIAKAHRLAHGQAPLWTDDLDLFRVSGNELVRYGGGPATPLDFARAMDRVYEESRAHGEFSSDVETDSKDSIKARLTAISFATLDGGLAATWAAWERAPAALAIAREMLSHPTVHKVFHNRIYDTIVLPRHGLLVRGPVDDTLLMHHASFPGLPHKLDQVATQFFITEPWKAEFRRGEKDEDSLILYNGRDSLATARLRPALKRMIDAHKVGKVYEADRQQFSVATHMRKTGYFVDRVEQARQSLVQQARLDFMRAQLAEEFRSIEPKWREAWARYMAQKARKKDPESYVDRVKIRYEEIESRERKPSDVGLLKTKAKADLVALFEVLRIPITNWTPKGAPVTDKGAMEDAAGRHPLMRRLLHINDAMVIKASFIDGLPIKDDGRVHPDWTPKITGRWGAGKAQNWPKFVAGWPPELKEDGITYRTKPSGDLVCPRENPRAIVTAPTAVEILALPFHAVDPLVRMRAMAGHGRMLVGADFAQLELRIAGYLARDKYILDIFRRGIDPHAHFAKDCFGSKFTDAEEEFFSICESQGLKLKPKVDLSKVSIDDITRARLSRPHAVWNRLRDLTKNVEYCGIYGGGAEVVYEKTVKLFPEAQLGQLQLLIDKINSLLVGVVRWRNEQETKARINREIREQLLGRVRLFPLGNFNPNIVYNFPIQAFASSLLAYGIFRFTALTHPELLQLDDLVKCGLLDPKWVEEKIAEGLGEWKAPVDILINGHDSLLVECDEEDAIRVCSFLESSMTQTLPMGSESMVFPAEAAIGRRWSET